MLTPSTGPGPVAAGAPPLLQPPGDHLGPVVVEAHPVDHGAVGGEPEQPRLRVAGLRLAGHGADLDVAEAQRGQAVDPLGVLVEAGGEAERVREGQPQRRHRGSRAGQPLQHRPAGPHRPEADAVRALGVDPAQRVPEEQVVRRQRAAQSCSDRTPISPARIASMPCTAAPSPCTVVMHGTLASTAAVRIS